MDQRERNNKLDVLEGILKALGGTPANLSLSPIPENVVSLAALITLLTTQVKAPTYSEVTVITAVTSTVTGNAYVSFGSKVCAFIDIVNHTGTDIEYRRNGVGEFITIPTGQSRMIEGITNANQIGVRRKDSSLTAVTVRAEAFVL